ncbi:hypothetical protein HDU67_004467 [Dinochytrium kinnereticum]|nr:hypothetical protein HDU67_004467 [Dinochytrium kinnereticum]
MSDRYWPTKRVSPELKNVFYGIDQTTNEGVVMKLIERENSSDSERNYRVRQEAEMLKELSHAAPHRIINFRDFYLNDEDQFVIVMERADCSVADILDQRLLSEDETKILMRAVLEGLHVIHKHYYCHRDIKPANLMLSDRNAFESLKIADFGICVPENGYSGLSGTKGTRGFMAPEVERKGTYGMPVDLWSAGAVAYKALLGKLAPVIPKQKGFMSRRQSMNFEGPPISEEAKDFLSKLLDSDPDARPTAEKALQHPWLNSPSHTTRSAPGSAAASPVDVIPQRLEGFDGWIQLMQPNGMVYFYNEQTGVTQWHHPGLSPSNSETRVNDDMTSNGTSPSSAQPAAESRQPKPARSDRPLPTVPSDPSITSSSGAYLEARTAESSSDNLSTSPSLSASPSPRRVRFNDDSKIEKERSPERGNLNYSTVFSAVSAFQAPTRSVSAAVSPRHAVSPPVNVEIIDAKTTITSETVDENVPLGAVYSVQNGGPEPLPAHKPVKKQSTLPPIPPISEQDQKAHVLDSDEVTSPSNLTSANTEALPISPATVIDEGSVTENSKWHKVKVLVETIYYFNVETGETVWNIAQTNPPQAIPPPPPPRSSVSSKPLRASKDVPSKPGTPTSPQTKLATSFKPVGGSNAPGSPSGPRKPPPSRAASTPSVEVRPVNGGKVSSVVGRSATTGPNVRTSAVSSTSKTVVGKK